MKTFQEFMVECDSINEIFAITPLIKKPTTKSQSQSKPKRKDPYGEDPEVTRKRLAAEIKKKKLKEEDEINEGIGMTMASALGNPPPLSKRMALKRSLIMNKIKSDAEKNKKRKFSGKAATPPKNHEED